MGGEKRRTCSHKKGVDQKKKEKKGRGGGKIRSKKKKKKGERLFRSVVLEKGRKGGD